MEKDIKEITTERIISLYDARKEGKAINYLMSNYLGYLDASDNFDFVTNNENYIAVN